jgi:hypothetical protein
MQSHIDIMLGNREKVGTVVLTQPDSAFAANRTASGFCVLIPAVVNFHTPSDESPLVLNKLTLILSAEGGEIGAAVYSALMQTPRSDIPITFSWNLTAIQLAYYERLREGREIKFQVRMTGDIHYLLDGKLGREPLSIPTFFQSHGTIGYPKALWTKMLRDLNFGDTILLEIPFRANVPKGWEPVWAALKEARECFDQGGTSGWNGCVGRVRLALEKWRKIQGEAEDLAGWVPPQPKDLRVRSKKQRYDVLRWHLLQCAHLAPHTTSSDSTQEDALFALSVLCTLLSIRNA